MKIKTINTSIIVVLAFAAFNLFTYTNNGGDNADVIVFNIIIPNAVILILLSIVFFVKKSNYQTEYEKYVISCKKRKRSF